jgi:hypothetical protein
MVIGRLPIEKLAAVAELKFVRYAAPMSKQLKSTCSLYVQSLRRASSNELAFLFIGRG